MGIFHQQSAVFEVWGEILAIMHSATKLGCNDPPAYGQMQKC